MKFIITGVRFKELDYLKGKEIFTTYNNIFSNGFVLAGINNDGKYVRTYVIVAEIDNEGFQL